MMLLKGENLGFIQIKTKVELSSNQNNHGCLSLLVFNLAHNTFNKKTIIFTQNNFEVEMNIFY